MYVLFFFLKKKRSHVIKRQPLTKIIFFSCGVLCCSPLFCLFGEDISSTRRLSLLNTPSAASTKKQTARSNPGASRKNGHKVSLFPFYRSAPHCSQARGWFVQLGIVTLSSESRIGDAQKEKTQ